jgi:hypothetical protein
VNGCALIKGFKMGDEILYAVLASLEISKWEFQPVYKLKQLNYSYNFYPASFLIFKNFENTRQFDFSNLKIEQSKQSS